MIIIELFKKNHLFQALVYKFKGGIELKKGPKRVKPLKRKQFYIVNFIKFMFLNPVMVSTQPSRTTTKIYC